EDEAEQSLPRPYRDGRVQADMRHRTHSLQQNRSSFDQVVHAGEHQPFTNGKLWNVGARGFYSGLMLAALITLPHFSVSSAMNLARSAGAIVIGTEPSSAIRALIAGSARPALICLLSLSIISGDVFLGAPMP